MLPAVSFVFLFIGTAPNYIEDKFNRQLGENFATVFFLILYVKIYRKHCLPVSYCFDHFSFQDVGLGKQNQSFMPVHPQHEVFSTPGEVDKDTTTTNGAETSTSIIPSPQKLRQGRPLSHGLIVPPNYIRHHIALPVWESLKRPTQSPNLYFPDHIKSVQTSRKPYTAPPPRNYISSSQRNVYTYTNSYPHSSSQLTPQSTRDYRWQNTMHALPSSLPQFIQSNLHPRQPLPQSTIYRDTRSDNPGQRNYQNTPDGQAGQPQPQNQNNRFPNGNTNKFSSTDFIHDLTSYYYQRYKYIPNTSVIRTVPLKYSFEGMGYPIQNKQQLPPFSNNRRSPSLPIGENVKSDFVVNDSPERGREIQYESTNDEYFIYDTNQFPPSTSFGEPYFDDQLPLHVRLTNRMETLSKIIRPPAYNSPPYHRNSSPSRYNRWNSAHT